MISVSVLLFSLIQIEARSYIYWILAGVFVFASVAIISILINCLFYKTYVGNILKSFYTAIKRTKTNK